MRRNVQTSFIFPFIHTSPSVKCVHGKYFTEAPFISKQHWAEKIHITKYSSWHTKWLLTKLLFIWSTYQKPTSLVVNDWRWSATGREFDSGRDSLSFSCFLDSLKCALVWYWAVVITGGTALCWPDHDICSIALQGPWLIDGI